MSHMMQFRFSVFLLFLSSLIGSSSPVVAQTISQQFPAYIAGLQSGTAVVGNELLYMLQNGVSRTTTASLFFRKYAATLGYVYVVGLAGNGTTDDTAALQTNLNICGNNTHGGKVILGPGRYLIDSADISIPTGCELICPTPLQVRTSVTPNFTSTKYSIILNPAYTIKLNKSSGTSGCAFLQKNSVAFNPATTRQYINLVNAFEGNALTLTAHSGSDITIKDTFIGGFTWGVIPEGESTGSLVPNSASALIPRLRLDHVQIDATNCVWVDKSFDISSMSAVECFPHMTAGNDAVTRVNFSIAGIADNGVGLYRVTCTAACASNVVSSSLIQTGDTVIVDGSSMVGAQSTHSNRWVATYVNSTHIDLQGSSSAAKVITGTTTNTNKGVKTLSATSNIGSKNWVGTDTGPTITDSAGDIPAATHVASVAPNGSGLILSAAATGSTVGDTLTITDTAWVSGGTLKLTALARRGIAFYFTNSDFFSCVFCFSYGHDVGFKFDYSMNTFDCTSCMVDNSSDDPSTIAIWIAANTTLPNTTNGIRFNGGTFIQQGQGLVANGHSGGFANSFMGMSINNHGNSPFAVYEFDNGNNILVGVSNTLAVTRYIWVGPSITTYSAAANNTMMDTITVP